MKRLLLLLLLVGSMLGQTPVTVTGTVQDTTGVLANSGTVTFTLEPQNSGILYFVAGTGVIAPQTGSCGIDALGNIKNLGLTGACTVWGTDVLQPANLTYQIQLFPNGNQGNTISNQCITGSLYSLNSPVFCPVIKPTPQGSTVITSPIQNNLIPASNGFFNIGSATLRYANGFFNNINTTTCTGCSAGYSIAQNGGVSVLARSKLNFLGALSVLDNPGNASTDVSVANAGTGIAGIVSTGVQSFDGNKTFNGNILVKGPRPWVDVTTFGAKGDGTTDDTTAIQQAINFACTGTTSAPANATCTISSESDVLIPQGTYKTTACLQIYGSTNIIGAGRLTSIIAKANNVNCTAGSIAAPARALNDSYAVDAIIAVVHPTSDYAYHWKISGVGLRNTGTASIYGIYSPRSSQSVLENSYISNVGTGFYANDDWLMTIRHTTVDTANFGYRWANDGSNNGTGTTLTLDNVYAENIALSCYNIFGLQYSSFNNTACDNLNVTDADNASIDLSYAAYGFNSSTNITLNGAGAEVIHGTVLSSQASVITVNAMRALGVTGYTSVSGSPAYVLITSNGSTDITASTFDAMTSPGSFFNLLTQLGGMLTVRSTLLPTGGNTFNSFSGGSSIINLNTGTMTITNSAGVTTLSPTSAVFGAGATFAGNVIPSVNGGFNLGGSSNGWLNTFQFYHHLIELTAPSSAGGQDVCYGDSTVHALECSYNAGAFSIVPLVGNPQTWTGTQTFSQANKTGQNDIVTDSGAINTTETIVVKTSALAANRLIAGTHIRATIVGTCTTSAANTSTFTVRMGPNGTTSDTAVSTAVLATSATTGTNIPFKVMLDFTVRTVGASAAGFVTLELQNQGTTGISATVQQIMLPSMSTFDTTAAGNIISFSYKTAASTTTSIFKDAVIEFVYD